MNKTSKILVSLIAIGVAVVCVGMGYTAVKNGDDTTTTVVTVNPTASTTTTTTQPTTETTTEKEPELADLLLGKWSDSAGMSGFEFFSDGKVSFTYANLESLGLSFDGVLKNGTYTLDDNKLTIAYSIYTATIDKTYEVTINGDELKMYDIEELKTSTFVRTDKFKEPETTGVSVSDELLGSWENKPLSKTYKFSNNGKVVVAIDGEGFDGVYVTENNSVTIQYTAYNKRITEKYTYAVTKTTLSLTDDQGTFSFSRMGTNNAQSNDGDILGIWRDSANLSGYEFKEGGVVSVTYVNITIPVIDVPVTGTFTGGYEIENGVLSLTYYIYGKKIVDSYTYEISGNALKLKNTDTGNVSTYVKQ